MAGSGTTDPRGRLPGSPNRDKVELRAMLAEKVHEFTAMRRQLDIESGIDEKDACVIIDDYDPLVNLALVSVDPRASLDQRIRCSAEVTQYVRPKLKSVEVTTDPESIETLESRRMLSERLVSLLEAASGASKPERTRPPAPPAADDDGASAK